MSTIDLPIQGWLPPTDTLRVSISFACIYVLYFFVSTIYDVYFGPLSKFPGPKLWAFSKIPKILTMVSGSDGIEHAKLHEKYGPIVRIGPNELSFAGGAQTWKDIYGFKKHGNPHPYKDPMFYGELVVLICIISYKKMAIAAIHAC